jgi:hypothetical protein
MDTDEASPELTCSGCTAEVSEDDAYYISHSNDVSCADCKVICEHCDDTGWSNDDWYYVDQSEMWCQSCMESHANYCDDCNEYHTGSSYYTEDTNSSYCENCIGNAYFCEDCDAYYTNGCDDHSGDDARVIHDYSYRPDPIFHSTDKEERLFFGLEIEVEASRNRSESAEYANRLEGYDLAYLKSDGSLNCGFEIVTHPMTHDFYKNEAKELWDTLEALRNRAGIRVKAWDASTTGLHIHISRTGFTGGAHMHRFLRLVYDNQTLYEAIAGRSSSRWAKFDDAQTDYVTEDEEGTRQWKSRRNLKSKLDNARNSDRYSAVNTQNHATLEMRIFRSSVNGDTVKSFIDLAHASVEYTRGLSVRDIRQGALDSDIFTQYIRDNSALYPELNVRLAKVANQLQSV